MQALSTRAWLQSGEAGFALHAADSAPPPALHRLAFEKTLAAESQPFNLRVEQDVRLVDLPWAALAAWLVSNGTATAQQTPTFTRDVAPILYTHCATCHRPGEIGGFSLLSFTDARPRAAAIARTTNRREMPPWQPDAIEGAALLGARRLEQRELDIIQRWVGRNLYRSKSCSSRRRYQFHGTT